MAANGIINSFIPMNIYSFFDVTIQLYNKPNNFSR